MEAPHSLATDSFSYSWLTHRHPILPEHSTDDAHNFNFDVPALTSPSDRDLVHADQIFSDGRIKPAYADPKPPLTSTSSPATPISLFPSRTAEKSQYCYRIGRWRRSSKKILQRCFRFVNRTLGRSRTSSRVDDLERKVFEVRSWSDSVRESPRASAAVDWGDFVKTGKSWRTDSANVSPSVSSNVACDSENSIHEAILYCKRSVGL